MQILVTIALIVIGVLLFEFIIFAHEFGHFITAKKSGVQVNEFALGMGPKLISFTRGETRYSLRAFPIGGFCAMEGEDESSDNPRAFTNAKIWKRMIIIVAGAFMNIVVGFILMFIVVVQMPGYESTTIQQFVPYSYSANSGLEKGDNIVNVNGYPIWNVKDLQFAIQTLQCKDVDPDSLTVYKQDCCFDLNTLCGKLINDKELLGRETTDDEVNQLVAVLQEGTTKINRSESKEQAYQLVKDTTDGFYSVLGITDKSKYEYPQIEQRDKRQRFTADLTVVRNGEKTDLKDVQFCSYYASEEDKENNKPSVSVDFYVEPIEKNFFTVIEQTCSQTLTLAKTVWQSLIMLVQGRFSLNDLSGPVGMTKAVSVVASEGLKTGFGDAVNNIIFIMALITVNLGVVNMLPFPALDGGRFVFLLIEAIFRKPLPRKFEYIVNGVGLVLLILFIAVITVKDIWQLITGTFPTVS